MILPDRYHVLGELGRGATGVVVQAFDSVRKHDVAIKFLQMAELNEEMARRFKREVRALTGISHPNIVSWYETGSYQDQDYLVMEIASGGDLYTFLQQKHPLDTLLLMFSQVAEGVSVLHSRGVIHRDLKPENILLSSTGVPKISDLGLARHLLGDSELTSQGEILGTLGYTAPEQVMSSQVGPEADVYALGVLIYEGLTRRSLFKADTGYALLSAHLREVPALASTHLPYLSPEVDDLLRRMLEKDPAARPTALEVASALVPPVPLPKLPESLLPCLRVACLIAEPFTSASVQAVLEGELEDTVFALDRLYGKGVLDEKGGGYWFHSPQLRRQLANSMTERSRRRLRTRIAQLGSHPQVVHEEGVDIGG